MEHILVTTFPTAKEIATCFDYNDFAFPFVWMLGLQNLKIYG